MQLPAFSMPCFFHTRGAKLLAGRQHDEGLPASFAFPHRFSKHDRCSRLPALHVVAPALTTFLDTAFLAIKRARSTDELLAAQDAAPRCHRIRPHPLFSALWTVPRTRTGNKLPAAISTDDLLRPFQDFLFFRHAFFFLFHDQPLFAKKRKPCRRLRRLHRFFLPFSIHIATAAFAIPLSPTLRTKPRSRSSLKLRAAALADMLYKLHQCTTASSSPCQCLPQLLRQNNHISIASLFECEEDFLLHLRFTRRDRDHDDIMFTVGGSDPQRIDGHAIYPIRILICPAHEQSSNITPQTSKRGKQERCHPTCPKKVEGWARTAN